MLYPFSLKMIKIHTLGGYDEVGRNMSAVDVDGEIVILDMGLMLESYIQAQEQDPFNNPTTEELRAVHAVPDDSSLDKEHVVAIIPSHAHLDHVGAIPYLEKNYNAPILCMPFTKALLKILAAEKYIDLKNKIKTLERGKIFETKHTKIEFISITHSTIQTVLVAIHTQYGTIVYANDFKMDNTPLVGKKPNLEALEKRHILALICDCIYAGIDKKTPSEAIARDMLEEIFEKNNFDNKAIIISTYSSHFARLQTIIKCARKIKRKIILVGRSLAKYIEAAKEAGVMTFPGDIEILKYRKQIKKRLEEIAHKKQEYIIIATGHQGEPNAILSQLAANQLPLKLAAQDVVILSSTVIPVEENQKNSEQLKGLLQMKQITLFEDIHVSGHAAGKDLKEFLQIVKPKHLIPAHGPDSMKKPLLHIAKDLGYSDEFLHICHNGDTVILE